jgi:hypothetical protein
MPASRKEGAMAKVTVSISTPVKLGGAVFMPGRHEVEPETADELAATGLLASEGETGAEGAASPAAVAARAAKKGPVATKG